MEKYNYNANNSLDFPAFLDNVFGKLRQNDLKSHWEFIRKDGIPYKIEIAKLYDPSGCKYTAKIYVPNNYWEPFRILQTNITDDKNSEAMFKIFKDDVCNMTSNEICLNSIKAFENLIREYRDPNDREVEMLKTNIDFMKSLLVD